MQLPTPVPLDRHCHQRRRRRSRPIPAAPLLDVHTASTPDIVGNVSPHVCAAFTLNIVSRVLPLPATPLPDDRVTSILDVAGDVAALSLPSHCAHS